MAEDAVAAGRSSWSLVWRPAVLLLGLVAAGWALRALPLRDFAVHAGAWGVVPFVAVGAVACAVGVPRQVVAFAGGYAHGVWLGAVLALACQVLGCAADLVWARLVARDWVRARLRGRRLQRLDGFLTARPFVASLTLRLLPVGNNVALNLLAGGLGVKVGAFLAASAIGYLPQTAVFALLGAGVRLDQTTKLILGIATFAASIALGLYLWRRTPPV